MPSPYRSSSPAPDPPSVERWHDGDLVVAAALLSPIFLAVVVGTWIQRQPFGAVPTICAGILVWTALAVRDAWSARRAATRRTPGARR